jgi:hypothetical protein
MTARAYRVQATGQFAGPQPSPQGPTARRAGRPRRAHLRVHTRGDVHLHADLTRFTLRYLLEVEDDSAAEADAAALVEGELLAADFLESRGLTHKPLNVSAVCLQDVKVKRRR